MGEAVIKAGTGATFCQVVLEVTSFPPSFSQIVIRSSDRGHLLLPLTAIKPS